MRISDWSSDVCSSDLLRLDVVQLRRRSQPRRRKQSGHRRLGQRAGRGAVGQRAYRERAAGQELERHSIDGRLRGPAGPLPVDRSEEHTSELQSLMRISYAVFGLKKKKKTNHIV